MDLYCFNKTNGAKYRTTRLVDIEHIIDYENTSICIMCISVSQWSRAKPGQSQDYHVEQAVAKNLNH